jgi:thiamine phosphate synthase YjbQ (UPF0047 family)
MSVYQTTLAVRTRGRGTHEITGEVAREVSLSLKTAIETYAGDHGRRVL